MAAIMYPPSRFQKTLNHCTWLSLLGLVIFVAILVIEGDFPGKGLVLMLTLVPGIVWVVLWAIISLRIR